MRSSIEKQCDLIAKGQADKEDVVALSLANFQLKFNYFVKNIHRMDTLFEASFSPLTAGGKPWSKCGLSNRYLQLIVARPQRASVQPAAGWELQAVVGARLPRRGLRLRALPLPSRRRQRPAHLSALPQLLHPAAPGMGPREYLQGTLHRVPACGWPPARAEADTVCRRRDRCRLHPASAVKLVSPRS
ncbi:MAG: hypothetical protein ACPIOQ_52800 [Promethearchaeia archaeon]